MSKSSFFLDRGDKCTYYAGKFDTEQPVINITGGVNPYLWIGGENGPCYATIQGTRTLRRFAQEILRQIPKKRRKRNALLREAKG